MSAVTDFPPRAAGRVLAEAMDAAECAAEIVLAAAPDLDMDAEDKAREAAATAAATILAALTADARMVRLIAGIMGNEAVRRHCDRSAMPW